MAKHIPDEDLLAIELVLQRRLGDAAVQQIQAELSPQTLQRTLQYCRIDSKIYRPSQAKRQNVEYLSRKFRSNR